MNILVTGASGFVGKHLIEYLSKNQDDRITATTSKNSFEHLPTYRNVRWVQIDIRNEESVKRVFQEGSFDQVYHLAGIALPNLKEYKTYYETNVNGTLHLLEAALTNAPKAKILIISSSHVYGQTTPTDNPISEKTKLNPLNHYAASKTAMEFAVNPYIFKGMNIVIARPFNHTGVGQTTDYVCSDFAYQFALMSKKIKSPILYVGNIDVERDFMDVRDVVRAYLSIMSSDAHVQVVNVCSGGTISIRTIINKLEAISGFKVEIRQQKERLRSNDVLKIVGSNEKLYHATGWKPEINIGHTLRTLYEYWLGKV